jgi:hypothetical protein
MTVTTFPKQKVFSPSCSGREIWDQKEPPSDMVWEICPYTRSTTKDDDRCHHCPQWEIDPDHGRLQRGCYAMAAEACRIVFAMQKRSEHGTETKS